MKTIPTSNLELVDTEAMVKELFKRHRVAFFIGEPWEHSRAPNRLNLKGFGKGFNPEQLKPLIEHILEGDVDFPTSEI